MNTQYKINFILKAFAPRLTIPYETFKERLKEYSNSEIDHIYQREVKLNSSHENKS